MNLQRVVRSGTPSEVSVLALICLTLAGGCLSLAAFPMVENAPRGLMVVLGLTGLAVVLSLLLAGPRVRLGYLHFTVVLFTMLIGIMVAGAVSERGVMLSVLGYIWMAVYAAFFFSPAAARVHAAVMIVVLGVSLLLTRAPTDVVVWIVISIMVWAAVSILTQLNARLRDEAQLDSLTGLLNRKGFAVAAARQRAMADRRGEPLALVVIDLDDFKLVNDRDGHAAGDRLLVELGQVWGASLRPGDLLARFGGDEFVLTLTAAGEAAAHSFLQRLERVHPTPWTAGAVLWSDQETLDEAMDRADALLYAAKETRRAVLMPEEPPVVRVVDAQASAVARHSRV